MKTLEKDFLIEFQDLGIERAYQLCYEEKKDEWENKISEIIEFAQIELTDDVKEKLHEYYVVSKIALMIHENESLDLRWEKIDDFIEAEELNYVQMSSICYDLVHFFHGGISVVKRLRGDELEKDTIDKIETIVRNSNGILDNHLTDSSRYTIVSFPIECLRSNYPRTNNGLLDVSIDMATLYSKLIDKKTLYTDLAREELEIGRSHLEQSENFVRLQAVRKEMNEIIERIIKNPVPYAYSNDYYGEELKQLIGKIIKFYHAVPDHKEQVINIRAKHPKYPKCNYEKTKGIQEHITAISDEIYERKVVEGIDDYLQDESLEEGLREYLINERNRILQTHPEVENWYLHLDYGFHYALFEDVLDDKRPGFGKSDKHYDVIKYYYFDDQRSDTYCGILNSLVCKNDNDYQTVYYGIRVEALREFLDDGENRFLDNKIKGIPVLGRASKRAKKLLFSKKNKPKKREESEE